MNCFRIDGNVFSRSSGIVRPYTLSRVMLWATRLELKEVKKSDQFAFLVLYTRVEVDLRGIKAFSRRSEKVMALWSDVKRSLSRSTLQFTILSIRDKLEAVTSTMLVYNLPPL